MGLERHASKRGGDSFVGRVLESARVSPFMALPPVLEMESGSGHLPDLFGREERGAVVVPAVGLLVVAAVVGLLHSVVDILDDPAGGREADFGTAASRFGIEHRDDAF